MKKSLLFVVAVVFSTVARSQAPGIKWKNPDPSLFKIELPKSKKSYDWLWAPINSDRNNLNINKLPNKNILRQGIVSLPVDGMPCLLVEPRKIDPSMLVIVEGRLPYIPNGYQKYPVPYR